MLESEEVGERASGQVGRPQSLVYTLPHTTESIAEFLTPALARVDLAAGGTQVVVVTRDAETALTISETVLRLTGPAGIEVVPVTSASRAARIFNTRPVLAVAGSASELGGLVRASLLKVDSVKTVVLAWADDILEEGPESVAALEALLSELGDASRVIVVRKVTPVIENLVERYASPSQAGRCRGDRGAADAGELRASDRQAHHRRRQRPTRRAQTLARRPQPALSRNSGA